jgi:hypothetical protein
MANNQFTRIILQAYSDKNLQDKVGEPYELPLNPEQYSQNYKIELDRSRGNGSAGTALKFTATAPEQLQLEFLFDSTGAILDYKKKGSAREQVNEFLAYVYDIHGPIHQPKFLKLTWGKNGFTHQPHGFDCILSNLDIKFVLFNREGEAIRAKVNATFLRYIEQKKETIIADRQSPDLTHIRTVKDGDRLSLMTYDIYADQSFYLKVARANNLTSFRKLKAGTEIIFPPIDKSA